MGRLSLSPFTQFCVLVCIHLHKWGTYASYLDPVIFDPCGFFFYHPLIPFYQSVCFLLFPSAHLLVVVAVRQHFSHYLFQAVLYIWAQTSDPGVLRYKISHPAIESLNCVTPNHLIRMSDLKVEGDETSSDEESKEEKNGGLRLGKRMYWSKFTKGSRRLRGDSLSGGEWDGGKFLVVRESITSSSMIITHTKGPIWPLWLYVGS